MAYVAIAVVGFVVAIAAALLPSIAKAVPKVAGADDRADWVNRLFVLASQADESGREEVASAARALISALVAEKPQAKKV